LISVTSFFRDPQVFLALREQVLPIRLRDRSPDAPLRMWVAGCASGEEVYSLVMCLLERMAELSRNLPLQIFATDLSEAHFERGRVYLRISPATFPRTLARFFARWVATIRSTDRNDGASSPVTISP
jgi:two-component system CheB/CheR fusion protein